MFIGEDINTELYKYFTPVPEEYHKKIWTLVDWLDQFNCVILYHQYTKADGHWHSDPSSIPAFIAFENEEDAVAFKLRWS